MLQVADLAGEVSFANIATLSQANSLFWTLAAASNLYQQVAAVESELQINLISALVKSKARPLYDGV